jgi:hypothetical protein
MLEEFVHAGVTQSCNLIKLFACEPTRVAWAAFELAPEISSGLSGGDALIRLGGRYCFTTFPPSIFTR